MTLTQSLRVPLLLIAGATLVALTPLPSFAQEKPAPEAVRELMPDLRSDDTDVRDRAEQRLFALGKAGRQALEKLARDTDPQVSQTALRLLSNPRWAAPEAKDAELPVRPTGELRNDLQRQLDEARRNVEQALRRTTAVTSGLRSGMVLNDEGRLSWTIDGEGRVKVSVRPEDGEEIRTYEADSLDLLREESPAIAERLDEVLSDGDFSVRFRMPELPELPALPPLPQLPDMSVFDELARRLESSRWPQGDVDTIVDWLAEREGRTTRRDAAETTLDRPMLGIEWEAPSAALRSHIGLETGGMVVQRVVPESLASRLGLRTHDILVALGETAIAKPADIRAALGSVAEGEEIEADVIRGGRRITVSAKR